MWMAPPSASPEEDERMEHSKNLLLITLSFPMLIAQIAPPCMAAEEEEK
jgi:hypothetical protein